MASCLKRGFLQLEFFFALCNHPFSRGTLRHSLFVSFMFLPLLKPCARFDSPQVHAQTLIPQKVALLWEGTEFLGDEAWLVEIGCRDEPLSHSVCWPIMTKQPPP